MKFGTFGVVAAVAAGLLSFPGCNATDDTTDPDDPTGVVRGWVRHRYSLATIAGATVACEGSTATSDLTGRFEFAAVPQGAAAIAVAAEGYQPLHTVIDVQSFQTVMLDLAPVDTLADVSGGVRHPVHGAVSATVVLGGRSTVADRSGRWALADVPLGRRSLVVTHPDFVTSTTAVVIHGDGQEILTVVQRDSTYTVPITADAGIHWSPDDGDENNYGDEVELSVRREPPRSVLLAIPTDVGPAGATVRAATLYLHGYLEDYMPPRPPSVDVELKAVFGVWYETSVDAANFPTEVGSPQARAALLTEQPVDLQLAIDVATLFTWSQSGPPSGILISSDEVYAPPMVVYSREAALPEQRPWLALTIRY